MRPDDTLEKAREVIRSEARALAQLADALDESFTRAIELISAASGRVIVSGMGKSGHVGRKIAATLASTGTPAFFVHPAEASHGDLGMFTPQDVALLLSNSGETPELSDIIAYTRRFSIPLIAVAGNAASTLIRESDIGIVLPDAGEACPMGLAPTTSTTMTLALGDALAVALMERHALTPERFRDLHPGGKLGARLTRVRDLMHEDMPLVSTDTPMSDALLVMSEKGHGVVGVRDASGALAGIITDGDLRRNMDGLLERSAGQVMTPDPHTITPDALAAEAVAIMDSRRITCLFVIGDPETRRAEGLLKIHDCLRVGVA